MHGRQPTHTMNIEAAERSPRQREEPTMFAVIFVVQPKQERWNDYLELAKYLKPKLEAIDGFIDNERFESKRTPGRLLSLSTWCDEKSVVRWRTQGEHHGVQEKGRFEIFADYHLRVGEIIRDTDPPAGLTVAEQRFDGTETGTAKVATITELTPGAGSDTAGSPDMLPTRLGLDTRRAGLVDAEAFASIYNPGKLLLLGLWQDVEAAVRWTPAQPAAAGKLRHRQVRIIRDYGMFDRREAPQYYGAVEPPRSGAE
jgi:heme-degrading monooxygenase HmoA